MCQRLLVMLSEMMRELFQNLKWKDLQKFILFMSPINMGADLESSLEVKLLFKDHVQLKVFLR